MLPGRDRLLTRALVVALALLVAPAGASGPTAAAAGWIVARQTPSGTFFRDAAPPEATADALVALAAAGAGGEPVARALAAMEDAAAERARERGAYAGRIVAGVVAAGADPRVFAGTDLVAVLHAHADVTGAYDDGNVFAHLQALEGLVAAGEEIPAGAVRYLVANACPDGGFGFDRACVRGADTDTTALAVAVLARAAPGHDALGDARAWLVAAANARGGFGFEPGQATNANSTGLVLAALIRLGERPDREPWARAKGDPLHEVLRLQDPEGGVRWRAKDDEADPYATVQALPGIAAFAPSPRPAAPAGTGRKSPEPPGEVEVTIEDAGRERVRSRPLPAVAPVTAAGALPVADAPPSPVPRGPVGVAAAALALASASFAVVRRRRV